MSLHLLVASAKLLDEACKTEKNADVLKRLLLVRRVRVYDEEEAASVAEKEFHRSRWWMGLQVAKEV
jgi:hypothetical protein